MGKHELEIENEGNVNKKQKLTSVSDNITDTINTKDLDLFLKDVSVPLVSSIEGTPEIEDIISGKIINNNNNSNTNNNGKEKKNLKSKNSEKISKTDKNNGKDTNKGTIDNKSKIPVDIIKGREYLYERYEILKDINLSNMLLKKKREEDEGIESESESESEDENEDDDDESESESESNSENYSNSESESESDNNKKYIKKNYHKTPEIPKEFEDFLELFDINPEEISLDLTLNEKRKLLIDNMDEKQLNRYEFFRRTNLNIGGIKKLINSITGVSVPNDFAKLVGGVGKVFVGDIVETAKRVQREENEARVSQQIKYKESLLEYENAIKKSKEMNENDKKIVKPIAPSFYEILLQAETGASLINIRRRVDTYDNFKVIIPKEEAQLTPDHIRESWRRLYHAKMGDKMVRWRCGGAPSHGLF